VIEEEENTETHSKAQWDDVMRDDGRTANEREGINDFILHPYQHKRTGE